MSEGQKTYKKGSSRGEGQSAEEAAAGFLEKNGVRITDRNFRCRMGEIDLIGMDGDICVFFEVKYRKSGSSGQPYEAVGLKKQKRICRTADFYRMKKGLSEDRSFRFDVISVMKDETKWYKNAFYYA